MSVESPASAFAAQSNMYAWVTGGMDAVESRTHFFRAYRGNYDIPEPDLDAPLTQDEIDTIMAHLVHEGMLMKVGTPVFVTSEAMDLVDEAVESMPSEVLLHQDLPMDQFVLWFERPLAYHPRVLGPDGEYHEEPWGLDGVGIQYKEHGILVNDEGRSLNTPHDAYQVHHEDQEPDLSDGVVMYCYTAHQNIPHVYGHIDKQQFGPYGLIDFVGVGFDVDWSTREIDGAARNLHKWVIAMMRLMGEHIELRSTGVHRALRRSAVRAGRKIPQDGYLSIMHLRSIVYEQDGEPGETEASRKLRWKHRVRGHWQRFYMASRKLPVGDPGAYRHRYVNSYVRGPGDAPVESHRVVVVDR